MKIAVPYENGQVFQHFGRSEQFKIYTAENGLLQDAEVIPTNGQGHGALTFSFSLILPSIQGSCIILS